MQDHVGAARVAVGGFGLEGAVAVGRPADGLVGARLGATAHDRHAVGDHKGRVEAHAELTDQLAVLGGVARELREEFFRARLRDRAEVLVRFFKRHADAVVRHRERPRFFVGLHADLEDRIVLRQVRIRKGEKAQLVDRVGSVRDELAQEHFLVGIKRIGQKLQKFRNFRLKTMDFGSHFRLILLFGRELRPFYDKKEYGDVSGFFKCEGRVPRGKDEGVFACDRFRRITSLGCFVVVPGN